MLEELWEVVELDTSQDSDEIQSEITQEDVVVMTVQAQDPKTGNRRQTLKLLAHIGK